MVDPTTLPLGNVQPVSMVASRFSTPETLQVRVYSSPAVGVALSVMLTDTEGAEINGVMA